MKDFALIDKLPHSIEAEKQLLGYLISDGKAFKSIRDALSPYDFALPQHQKLFSAMGDAYKKYQHFDKTILLDYLRENRDLEKIGGEAYIVQLLEPEIPIFKENVDTYVRVIKEKSMLRKVHEKCVSIIGKCREHNSYSLEEMEKEIFELRTISQSNTENIYKSFASVCRDTIVKLSETPDMPMTTGFSSLDTILGGLYKNQVTVLAADTSMGKSALAQNIYLNLSKQGHKVAYLTLEMTNEEMAIRGLQMLTGFPFSKIREMRVSSEEYEEITKAVDFYDTLSGLISDKNVTIHDIKRTTRKLKEESKIDLIVIDHLHFITSHSRHETRAMEVDLYTKEFKALAKELDISILLLAQLNRSSASQVDKRPMLKDLKDSSGIAQNADNVVFIYRDWIYNKEADPTAVELIIDKNRNGERNVTVFLKFDGSCMTFSDRIEVAPPVKEIYGGALD